MNIELTDMQLFGLAAQMAEEILRNVQAARRGVRLRTVAFRDGQRTVASIEDYFDRVRFGAMIKERLGELFLINDVPRTRPRHSQELPPERMTAAQHNAFPRGRWASV